MEVSPCKGCTNRYPACHDKCLTYIDWQQRCQVVKEQRFKMKEADHMITELNVNRMRSFGRKH